VNGYNFRSAVACAERLLDDKFFAQVQCTEEVTSVKRGEYMKHDPAVKAEVLALLARGVPGVDIAVKFKLKVQTVYTWKHKAKGAS
jgi:hypothetical protein